MAATPESRLYRRFPIDQYRIDLWKPISLEDLIIELRTRHQSAVIVEPNVEEFLLPDIAGYRTSHIFSNSQVTKVVAHGDGYEAVVDDADYVLFRGRILRTVIRQGITLTGDSP